MAESIPAAAEAASHVEVRALTRDYGAVRALDGVTLDIARGELFGLIGHNGAGKTTLFKTLLGLIAPSAGEVRIDGVPAHGAGFRAVRREVGYLPENLVFYDNLTGLETLRFFARLKAAPAASCAPLLESVGLGAAAGRRVREYSKGMRQRLGLAQALLGAPRLLLLDEPTSGLDPEGIREFFQRLQALRAAGVTIVLSSHVLAEIQQRVDRLAILAAGRLRALGSVATLRATLDLPVTIDLRCVPTRAAALRERLASLPATVTAAGEGAFRLACARQHKRTVLAAVLAAGEDIVDIELREPSLEDLFFGLAA